MFGINIQTLHYYDQIGVLKPALRNPDNGRRYYSFDQVYKLSAIRFMRKLDCSMDQIKAYGEITDYTESLNILRMHSQKMREQWKNLLLMDNIIQRKISFVENAMQEIDVHSVTVQEYPERSYLPLGGEGDIYYHDSFYHYPTIVFYRGGKNFFGAYLDLQVDGAESSVSMIVPDERKAIPAGQFVCGYHVGPYTTLHHTASALREQFSNFQLEDEWVTFNIIDQFVENDPEKYITGVQIRIVSR